MNKEPEMVFQHYGMDVNYIVHFVLDVDPHIAYTSTRLHSIADLIEDERYEEATTHLDQLNEQIGVCSDTVRLGTRIDRIRILGK